MELWPQVLPDWVRNDTRRRAEVKVYDALAGHHGLDGWWGFYDAPFHIIDEQGRERDGQADFVLVHPSRGVLFLEVKGGGISFEPERGLWFSQDGHGFRHAIKDPVHQAQNAEHEFWRDVCSSPSWRVPSYARRALRKFFSKGAVFPDCDAPGRGNIGPHERRYFCDRGQLATIGTWILSRLPAAQSENFHGDDVLELIRDRIAKPVKLRVPLVNVIQNQQRQQDALLTGEQRAALLTMEENPRCIIRGAAGTGKTVIASEMAARLAEGGKRVLMLCYSASLCLWLERRLAPLGVSVLTFADLCLDRLGRRAEGAVPLEYPPSDPDFPALVQAARNRDLKRQWDAIIVDEGQDFQRNWWDVVEAALVGGSNGILQVFCDANQAIYARVFDVGQLLGLHQHVLRHNLRNTQAIADMARPFYKGPAYLSDLTVRGDLPVVTQRLPDAALASARDILETLHRADGVDLRDVAILLPSEVRVQAMRAMMVRPHRRASEPMVQGTVVDTVDRFKGLDAAVVVLVVDGEVANDDAACYVGLTRARTRVYVLGATDGTKLANARDALNVGR